MLPAVTSMRVEAWSGLDMSRFGLFHDLSDAKKNESWGTEPALCRPERIVMIPRQESRHAQAAS
jgi:hypothetical protein